MNIQCNWCMSVFDEDKIVLKGEEEYCPNCNFQGYLMDLDERMEVDKGYIK